MRAFMFVVLQLVAGVAIADEQPCADALSADFTVTVVGDSALNASEHFLQACYNFQQVWGVESMSEKRVAAVVMTFEKTESSRFEGTCGDQAIEPKRLGPAADADRLTPASFMWR